MTKIATFAISPSVNPCLGQELLVEKLPSDALREGSIFNLESLSSQTVPENGVFTIGKEDFLPPNVRLIQEIEIRSSTNWTGKRVIRAHFAAENGFTSPRSGRLTAQVVSLRKSGALRYWKMP